MSKNMILLIFLLFFCNCSCVLRYDTYRGSEITYKDYLRYVEANITSFCVTTFKPCDPQEGRRIDGTCNNLKHPTRGASMTPYGRLLPIVYDKNFEPRKAKCGYDLPNPRYLRTRLLTEGRIADHRLTQLAVDYLTFLVHDIVTIDDTLNYVVTKPYCCDAKGKTDRECIPIRIPEQDPVHRFSNIRCMNMTRPISFQSKGCLSSKVAPESLPNILPIFSLAAIYGTTDKAHYEKARLNEGGLLKTDVINGQNWPPSAKKQPTSCLQNEPPRETRCPDTPTTATISLMPAIVVSTWFWRYHNKIAIELKSINPCWDDDKLFSVARDINLAMAMQMLYYELLPIFFGRKNLIKHGAISSSLNFRDVYDELVEPKMMIEFPYALRYFHTMQNGELYMFDTEGNYMKRVPVVNMTLRPGMLDIDNNAAYITQGMFRQGCAASDHTVDPEISESGLGRLSKAQDISSTDLAKGRYLGLQPYIKYLEFCHNVNIRTFDDLNEFMDPQRILILRDLYNDIEDVELMAGIWSERHMKDTIFPPTLFCLLIRQFVRNVVSDRHWYERPNRPNAFTLDQLLEIRKMTIARMVCDVGDSVWKIQPQAFRKIGPGNQLTSCDNIASIDFGVWKDDSCNSEKYYDDEYQYEEIKENNKFV